MYKMCDIFPSFLLGLHFFKSYTIIDDGPTPTTDLVHYCKIQLKYLFIQFENKQIHYGTYMQFYKFQPIIFIAHI